MQSTGERLDREIDRLTRLSRLFPGDPDILATLCESLLIAGYYEVMLEVIPDTRQKGADVRLRWYRATALMMSGPFPDGNSMQYQEGVGILQDILAEPLPSDPGLPAPGSPSHFRSRAAISLADAYRVRGMMAEAQEILNRQYLLSPGDDEILAYHLAEHARVSHPGLFPCKASAAIDQATRNARASIRNDPTLPYAWFRKGLLELLAGDPYESLKSYARGVALTPSAWILQRASGLLNRFHPARCTIAGYKWVERFLLLARAARGDPEAMRMVMHLRKRTKNYSPAVVILAGGCDERIHAAISGYEEILLSGFESFTGFLCSGGTRDGVSGLAGAVGAAYPGKIQTIGYLPNRCSDTTGENGDSRYTELIRTGGEESFTPMQSLQNWTDIIASGIDAGTVRLLGINGGKIAAVEFRIALALWARVGLIAGSGREADILAEDADWSILPSPEILSPGFREIRAFITGPGPDGRARS